MNSDILKLINFKQEIMADIETYMEILTKSNDKSIVIDNNNTTVRLIKQIISYYDRMKSIYSSKKSDDDDEDETFISDNDEDDYCGIMSDRIYIKDSIINDHHKELNKKILGCGTGYDKEFGNLDEYGIIDDNSVDSVNYDDLLDKLYDNDEDNNGENNNGDDSEEDDDNESTDCITNNIKKTIIPFVQDTEIEISVDCTSDNDYNEPTIE